MSSLLQFNGKVSSRGVGLQFYLVQPGQDPAYVDREWAGRETEPVWCKICGRTHPRVYVAFRRPHGMFGCWVTFQYNGKLQIPDLSCPQPIFKLPKGAKPLTDEENDKLWHR